MMHCLCSLGTGCFQNRVNEILTTPDHAPEMKTKTHTFRAPCQTAWATMPTNMNFIFNSALKTESE